ncbi:MAG: hypothetical protein GX087_00980 [Desulfobulbaceae bacterium]|nr:hypothetical protein [Desulfobulbaceae bacterium]
MKKKILQAIVFCFFTISFIFVLLMAGELFLRWYYRDVLSVAAGPSYFAEKANHLFMKEINPYGLRGRPIAPQHDGRYRIVVQGDSFTYGQGIYPIGDRYTELLENSLANDSFARGVVVFNAGICGYNLQEHIRYAKFVKAMHPDFVLYQWFLNDMKNNYQIEMSKSIIRDAKIHKYLMKHSALYNLIQLRYAQIRSMSGKEESFDADMIKRFRDPASEYSQHADKLLDEFFASYVSQGIDFGVVLFPSFFHDMSDYQLGFIHERVLARCKRYGVKCLDLQETYKNTPHTELWVNPFDAHPGKLANKMAAEAIHDFYGSYWKEQAQSRQGDASKPAKNDAQTEVTQ